MTTELSKSALTHELQELRAKLRQTDEAILDLVIQRMQQVENLAQVKEALGLAVLDRDREKENSQSNQIYARKSLDVDFVSELSDLLARWARMSQERLRK